MRTVLVTGGARGLGYAIAAEFACNGFNVALTSRNVSDAKIAAERIRALAGSPILPLEVDVGTVQDVRRAVAEAVDRFGRLDVLVNNAGVSGAAPALEIDEHLWDQVQQTNLKGTFFAAQAAAQVMKANSGGVIVNIASVLGKSSHNGVCAYSVSKAGVIQLTKSLAVEWAPYGIRVVAVAPAFVQSDMNRVALSNERYLSKVLSRTPLGRLGTLEEVAKAVLFMASAEATYITGTTLDVDGGWLAV
jgi:NAD(P)-dependent dehydrogenase (short-subunit alcohol dehydrogenase family)